VAGVEWVEHRCPGAVTSQPGHALDTATYLQHERLIRIDGRDSEAGRIQQLTYPRVLQLGDDPLDQSGVEPLSVPGAQVKGVDDRNVYQQARRQPICASHGQTASAGASMVMARVD
jgi:hypothetical protein